VTNERLAYPVLTIAWNGFLSTGDDEHTLSVCSATGFESGFYDSLRIIDSSGAIFTVRAARKARLVKGGLRQLIGAGLWQVELDLARGETMGLPEIKAQVIAALHRRPDQVEEDGTLGEALGAAEAATTLKELMGLFAGDA
jgi:hypothetical protein